MADPLGELFVKIDADTKGLKTGLTSAEGSMNKFSAGIKKHSRAIGMAMTAMGAAIVASAVLSIKAWARMGDEVAKMAKRTGFTTEALSELSHAAELSGASLAGIEKASRTLSGAITDAGFGLETYVRAFRSLNLAYEDLAKLSPEEQLLAVLEALAGLEDETLRAAIAADIMGRSGTAMLPMLADGAEGLREMRLEAHELGKIFDMEAAVAAENFTDTMTRLTAALDGVKFAIAEGLAPQIEPLIEGITDSLKGVIEWTGANRELTTALTSLAVVGGLLLTALGPLLIVFPGLIAFAGSLSVAIIPLLGLLGLLAAGIGMITAGLVMLGMTYFKNLQTQQEYEKALAGEENRYIELVKLEIERVKNLKKINEEQTKWLQRAGAYVSREEERIGVEEELAKLSQEGVKQAKAAQEAIDKQTVAVQGYNAAMGMRLSQEEELLRMQAISSAIGQWAETFGWTAAEAVIPGVSPFAPGGMASFQHGGTVPGPIGQPVPIIAHGGEQFLGEEAGIQVNIYGDTYGTEDLISRVSDGLGEAYMRRSRMRG